jgi:hypothetical protein
MNKKDDNQYIWGEYADITVTLLFDFENVDDTSI